MKLVVAVWPDQWLQQLSSYLKNFKNEILNDSKQLTEKDNEMKLRTHH
jgi:hypothetical protein